MSTVAAAPFDDWLEQQLRHSAQAMLASVSPVGIVKRRPGFGQVIRPVAGAIVASPVLADWKPDPDYFFHWFRDSAVVVDALRLLRADGRIGDEALAHLRDFTRFSLALNRLDGRTVGIIANNPLVKGGALDVDACEKITSFIVLCDSFNIPLVMLVDTPGFVIGTEAERRRAPGKIMNFMNALALTTMPKLSVVLRKSYGAGYFVMNGLAYECDHLSIWPTAEIAVMGPEGMVNITMRRHLEQFEEGKERDAERIRLADEFRRNIDPWIAAGHAQVDDVIDPADTRSVLIRALEANRTKAIDRPWRKHGVPPV